MKKEKKKTHIWESNLFYYEAYTLLNNNNDDNDDDVVVVAATATTTKNNCSGLFIHYNIIEYLFNKAILFSFSFICQKIDP